MLKNNTKWNLILSDIDAGGGTIIDLYFNPFTKKVKEIKEFNDGSLMSIIVGIDEYDPENYGKEGQVFLDKVNKLKSR